MKLNTKFLVEMLGIVAIVLSLLFVAFQIQQANRIARIATEIEISNLFATWNEIIFLNDDARKFLESIPGSLDDLPRDDQSRALAYGHRMINIWQPAITAYESGLLSEERYEAVLTGVRGSLARPGGRAVWRRLIVMHPEYESTTLFLFVKEILDNAQ